MAMPVRKPQISRTFIAAVLQAVATVLIDPKDPQTWTVAAGIIAAAVSGGVHRAAKAWP